MLRRIWVRGITASALALAATQALAVNIVGTSAQLSWGAAAGPVSGYAVQVSRAGSTFREESRVAALGVRVGGAIGETIRVRVAAYDPTGRVGPASTPSDSITFVPVSPPAPSGDLRADLDGNGTTDAVVFAPATGALAASLLQADGSRRLVSIGTPRDPLMRPVGFSDVDGDGRADLMLRNPTSGANELWLFRGLTYSVVALPGQAARFRVASFRDFSGDGRADAFFHDALAGESTLWTLAGGGFTRTLAVDAAPAGAALAAILDVNGDRSPDLVWRNVATQALEAWLLAGVTPRAVVSLGLAPANASVAGVGDFDADRTEDLVWNQVSDASASLRVWFLAGANAPRMGLALRLPSTSRLRGVADVNSDGRDELIVMTRTGAIGYSVSPVLASAMPPQWTTRAIPLSDVPYGTWRFLALE